MRAIITHLKAFTATEKNVSIGSLTSERCAVFTAICLNLRRSHRSFLLKLMGKKITWMVKQFFSPAGILTLGCIPLRGSNFWRRLIEQRSTLNILFLFSFSTASLISLHNKTCSSSPLRHSFYCTTIDTFFTFAPPELSAVLLRVSLSLSPLYTLPLIFSPLPLARTLAMTAHCTSPRWRPPTWVTTPVTPTAMSSCFRRTPSRWTVRGLHSVWVSFEVVCCSVLVDAGVSLLTLAAIW